MHRNWENNPITNLKQFNINAKQLARLDDGATAEELEVNRIAIIFGKF